MTQQELQRLVEELSLSVFNKPFTHRAVFNSRLKTTGGRYHLSDHHLDFNPAMLTEHGMEGVQTCALPIFLSALSSMNCVTIICT